MATETKLKPPERIWLCPQNYEAATTCCHPSDTEYVRADLVRADHAPEVEKLKEALEAMRNPPLILEGDSAMDVAGWFVAQIDAALSAAKGE